MKIDYIQLQYPHHKSYWRCWWSRQSIWKLTFFAVAISALFLCEWFGPNIDCYNWTQWWLAFYPEIATNLAIPYALYKLCINK